MNRLKPSFIESPDLNNQEIICSAPEPVKNNKTGHTSESHTTTKSGRKVKFIDVFCFVYRSYWWGSSVVHHKL